MQVSNIAIWDLETGGLVKEKDALAEIAIIVIDSETLEELDRYEAIIAPYSLPDGSIVNYNPKALEINGLTMTRIQAGTPAKQVAQEIAAFCKKWKKNIRGNAGKLLTAGHNIDEFDIPRLEFFLNLFKIDYYDLFQRSSLDTMTLVRHRHPVDGSIPDHKLITACEKVGINLYDAHRAMNDVEANAKLIIHYLKCLRGEGQSGLAVQEETSVRSTFRF